MKNSLKFISLLIIVFLMIGCQKEELPSSEDNNVSQKVQSWYNQEHNKLMDKSTSFVGQPDWKNHFQLENDIYFPLISDSSEKLLNQKKLLKNAEHTFVKSYLVFNEKEDGSYNETLKVFFSKDENSFDNPIDLLKNASISYIYDNLVDDHITHDNLKNIDHAKARSCTTWLIVRILTYSDGSVDVDILSSYDECDGGGSVGTGGGGGDGDGSDRPTEDDETIIPDCSSFVYENLPNVSWQESLVEGLYFDITLLQTMPVRVKRLHTIKLPQTIRFGVPTVDRHGNRVSAGIAANVTAKAIHQTAKEIAFEYGGKPYTSSYITIQFRELLKKNFPLYTYGGRVNFNDMNGSTQIPTRYRATPNPFNNCN